MTSTSVAVVIDRGRKKQSAMHAGNAALSLKQKRKTGFRCTPWWYLLITMVFLYTTTAIIIEKPDGIKIAGAFIVAIVFLSMVSRTRRSMELRSKHFDFVGGVRGFCGIPCDPWNFPYWCLIAREINRF